MDFAAPLQNEYEGIMWSGGSRAHSKLREGFEDGVGAVADVSRLVWWAFSRPGGLWMINNICFKA